VALVAERARAADQLNVRRLDVVRASTRAPPHRTRQSTTASSNGCSRSSSTSKRRGTWTNRRPSEVRSRAREETRTAIDELRDLARGTFPPALAEVRLSGALTALAAMSRPRSNLVELPDNRVDVAVETAAYFVVAEALTTRRSTRTATIVPAGLRSRRQAAIRCSRRRGRGSAEGGGTGMSACARV